MLPTNNTKQSLIRLEKLHTKKNKKDAEKEKNKSSFVETFLIVVPDCDLGGGKAIFAGNFARQARTNEPLLFFRAPSFWDTFKPKNEMCLLTGRARSVRSLFGTCAGFPPEASFLTPRARSSISSHSSLTSLFPKHSLHNSMAV